MNEELKIKLVVDTSDVTSSVNKIKQETTNVNNATKQTNQQSVQVGQQATKSVEQLSGSIGKLFGGLRQLSALKGGSLLDFAEMGVEIAATAFQTKAVGKNTKEAKKATAEMAVATKAVEAATEQVGVTTSQNIALNEKYIQQLKEMIALTRAQGSTTATPIARGGRGGQVIASVDEVATTERALSKYTASANAAQQSAKGASAGIETAAVSMGSLAVSSKAAAAGGTAAAEGTAAAGTAAGGAAAGVAGLSAAFIAVAAAIAAVVAVIAVFVTAVKNALNVSKLGNEVYHAAQKFGFSTKAYQEWGYIMERNGSTVEDLSGFLETLASEQAAVVEGSEGAIENFKRLGLSMEEVVGMNQQELFTETVKRIQSIEDATQRSAIAYSIFGDEASKIMNVLNMNNAEMEEMITNYEILGGGMSDSLIEKSHSLQGAISNLKQAWKGIGNTLGEVFMPAIKAVVNWLTKALVVINLFLRSIFGMDLKTKGAGGSMEKATGSVNKYTGATKSATKAAEALKRTTMGFDELNIVNNPNSSAGDSGDSGGGGFDTSGLGAGFDDSMFETPDLTGIYEWFEKYKTLIRDITAWSLTIIGVIMIVVGCLSGFNLPLIAGGMALAGLGIAIGSGEGGTWDRFFKGVVDLCKNIKKAVSDWLKDMGEKLGKIGDWINENVVTPVVNFFKGLWDGIVNIFKNAPQWFENIFNSVRDFILNAVGKIGEAFANGWAYIKGVWGAVTAWFDSKIIQPIGNFFSNMWNGLKNGASNAWSGIKSVFSSVVSWFREKFTAAWTAVKNVFSTGGKIFDGIKEGIAATFKTVVNGIIGGINKVIAVPFNAINKLLNKIRSVSVAGIEPFKDLIKYNALSVPQIPKLARGGIVDSATIAMIGENGREAVVPLENNTQWIDKLVDAFDRRNPSPTKIVLMLDKRQLGEATIDSINDITKQTGELQLAIV